MKHFKILQEIKVSLSFPLLVKLLPSTQEESTEEVFSGR